MWKPTARYRRSITSHAIVSIISSAMGKSAIEVPPSTIGSRPISDSPVTPPPAMVWTTQVDHYASKEPARITRAAYLKDDGTLMVFADNAVAHVMAEKKTPASPAVLLQLWPNLLRAGIPHIDAILPDPKLSKTHCICIFWKELYVRLNDLTGELIAGPHNISQTWVALRKAGFQTVDAVLPCSNSQATFFCRNQYATISFDLLNDGVCSDLVESGSFADRWPVLARFTSIDFVLPERHAKNRANFFSGQQYVSAEIEFSSESAGTARSAHQHVSGVSPAEIGKVTDRWTALKDIGFY